jgi:hypothetical protein
MKRKKILNYINKNYPDLEMEILLADGFESAFLGIGQQFNTYFAVYDKNKCIDILTEEMTEGEAEEYFDFNVVGAYVGKHTPVFIDKLA